MHGRVLRTFGSVLMLSGAFAIGGVLNGVFVEGTIALLSPVAVLGVLVGVVLVAVGYRLEEAFDPSEYVPADTDEDDDEGEEADESWGPISEEMLEGREADEDYEGR